MRAAGDAQLKDVREGSREAVRLAELPNGHVQCKMERSGRV